MSFPLMNCGSPKTKRAFWFPPRAACRAGLASLTVLLPLAVVGPVQARQEKGEPPVANSPVVTATLQEIAALFKQADDAYRKSDYAGAERSFQSAYDRAESIGDPYSMGVMLDGLGNVYAARGDARKAIATQTRAIELLRRSGNKPALARALMNHGNAHRRAGRLDDAIDATLESVRIWDQQNNASAYAAALVLLGDLYKEKGQFAAALATIKRSLQIAEAANAGPRPLAGTHLDLGNVYEALAQFGDARREYQIGIQFAQAGNDPEIYASALSNLGMLAARQGRFSEAQEAHNKALQLRQEGSDPQAVARSLANLGAVAYSWGRFDMSLFYSRRALSVAEKVGAKDMIARQNVNVGASLNALGQERKAEEAFLRAIALYDEMGAPDAATDALANLGAVRYAQGDYAGALPLLNRVLEVDQKRNRILDMAKTLRALGATQDALGKPDIALALFLQANAAFLKMDSPQDLANSYNDLGAMYVRAKRTDEALTAFNRSLALKQRIGENAQGMATVQSNLALLYGELGQWDKSAALMKEAVASTEALRDQVAAPAEIGALQKNENSLRDIYTRYASVLLHLNQPEDALIEVERGRGQGLARQAAQARTTWTGLLSAANARKMAATVQDLRQAEANLQSAEKQASALRNGDEKSLGVAEREVNEATRLRDEAQQTLTLLRTDFAARFPRYRTLSGLDAPTMATFTDLSKARPDTLFLSWSVTPENKTLLFALRADTGLKAFTLPVGGAVLSKMAREWREAIAPSEGEGPGRDPKREEALAHALYETLFAAVEKAGILNDGITKRLVVIGDGPLREIPFAALLGNKANQRLIERFPLSTGVSLRLLVPVARAEDAAGPETPPAGRGILCVADPGGGAAAVQPGDVLDGFAPLPAARREGQAIGRMFGEGATVLIGNAATKEAVLGKLGTARLLHFATHGYLDEENGLKSGLLIAPPVTIGNASDFEPEVLPLLTGEEIVQSPLAADLVTLSACETGRGERSGGEGLLGLVWAFRAAGCPSVVASQWSVDDDATGRFMIKFYEELRAGCRRDDALRTAMLFVRGDGTGRTAPPFFWAAFQLHGEATPLATR